MFRNMRLLGNQDTLYAASKGCSNTDADCPPARQYFADCYIEGNVDFIFGDGNAVFENCEIRSTAHNGGYITAQSKESARRRQRLCLQSLQADCRARSYRRVRWAGRGGRMRPSIFLNTEMGAHIEPAGWHEWHAGETKYLDTAYYAEYNSTGPGAHPRERDPHTKLLTAAEAAKYETKRFLAGADGWDPTAPR